MKKKIETKSEGMKAIDLVGRKFGKLTVLRRAENKGQQVAFECICECGKSKVIRSVSLLTSDTKSCGCARSEKMRLEKTTHGYFKSPTYNSYRSMLARCSDSKHPQFKDYGGRGISVCESQ